MLYVMEVTNENSFREAEELSAKTLREAKIEAANKQCFYGTVLEIGTAIDSEGFLIPSSVIAYRKGEGKWRKPDER